MRGGGIRGILCNKIMGQNIFSVLINQIPLVIRILEQEQKEGVSFNRIKILQQFLFLYLCLHRLILFAHF